MKKLLFLILLIPTIASAQWIGGTLQGLNTGNKQLRGNFGSSGFIPFYTKGQIDSLKATITGNVSSVFGRTGVVTAQNGDYSSFYPLLNGTGATGTWGIGITGNAGTVTNGVYTTTFNTLGDARYPLLVGSYANPSWIASLPWSKITATPTTLAGYGITDGISLTYFNSNIGTSTAASIATKEPLITTGTTLQYWRGDKTFQTLNTAVVPELTNLYYTNARGIGSTLTGYTSGAGTVAATDNILQAIQKINGNIGGLVTGVSSFNTRTGAITLTSSDVTTALTFTPENSANKATTYGTINNTLYPSIKLVSDSTIHPNKNLIDITNKPTALVNLGAAPVGATMYIGTTAHTLNRASASEALTGITSIDGSAAKWTTGRTVSITGDIAYTSPSIDGSGNVTAVATLPTVNSNVGSFNTVTVNAKGQVTAASNTSYENPLTFSTGLTRSTNTITVNTSQNITNLTNLNTAGFVKTTGVGGALSIDNSTYLTGNQTISFAPTGDVTGSTTGTTTLAPALIIGAGKVTNTMLAGSIDLTTKVTGLLPDANISSAAVWNVKQSALSGTGIVKSTAGTISYLTDNSTNWNTAFTQTRQWDGGSTGLVAATGRTSLGLVIGTDVLAYRTFGTAANNNTGDFEVPLTFTYGLNRTSNTIKVDSVVVKSKASALTDYNILMAGINTKAASNSTTNIGTTSHTLNRASGAEALTGITSIDGSAAKWTTPRTLSITGDIGYTSPSIDGSGNVTAAAILPTVNSNVGTFNNVTVNGKGLVTAASNSNYLTGAGTAGQFSAYSAANTLVPSSYLTFAFNSPYTTIGVGVGTVGINDPVSDRPHYLEINNDAGTASGHDQQMIKLTSVGTVSYQNNFHWNRFDGTFASPTNTKANMYFMSMGFRGWDSTNGASQSAASFQAQTLYDWSATSHPIRFNFDVTNVGSVSRVSAFQIRENADLYGGANLILAQSDKLPWNPVFTTVTLGNGAMRGQSNLNNLALTNGLYYDTAWKYANASQISSYFNMDETGAMAYYTAPGGTVNTSATTTKRFGVDISGNGYFWGNLSAVLPSYSSGTYLPVIYNSTNSRFETSTSAFSLQSAYNNGSAIQAVSGTPINFKSGTDAISFQMNGRSSDDKSAITWYNNAGTSQVGSIIFSSAGMSTGGNLTSLNSYNTSAMPSISLGAGATGSISIVGNNQDGIITFTGTYTSGDLAIITMSGGFAYPTKCTPVISGIGGTAGLQFGPTSAGMTTTGWRIGGGSAIVSALTLAWTYHNGGY